MIVKHLSTIRSFPGLWSPLLSNTQREGTLALSGIHAISYDFNIEFFGENIVFIYFIFGGLFYFDLILQVAGLQVFDNHIQLYYCLYFCGPFVCIKTFYYIIPSTVS